MYGPDKSLYDKIHSIFCLPGDTLTYQRGLDVMSPDVMVYLFKWNTSDDYGTPEKRIKRQWNITTEYSVFILDTRYQKWKIIVFPKKIDGYDFCSTKLK